MGAHFRAPKYLETIFVVQIQENSCRCPFQGPKIENEVSGCPLQGPRIAKEPILCIHNFWERSQLFEFEMWVPISGPQM